MSAAALPVQAMLFDQAAEPADGAKLASATPNGKHTNLGGAVAQALCDTPQPPLAVIALTDGIVNESAASSFFAVVDGVLRTAPLDRNILPGVTRHIILDLCRTNGVACEERAVSVAELAGASEAFISNSAYEILPVTRIDAATVGHGVPGPVARRLMALFAAKVAAETGGKAECAKGLA